jgi:hypothetical protein
VGSWKPRRTVAIAVLGASTLALAGTAFASAGKAPAKAKVLIAGSESFKPNQYLKIGFHFAPGTVVVRSGATITMANSTPDPHTLSIVTKSQLPRTFKQLESCAACAAIAKSHGINIEEPPTGPPGPPPHPLVDVGAAGFNAPGDSIVIGPKGRPGGQPVTFKVTAAPGTTLNFLCVIHPWMQGRFLVK